MNLLDLLNPSLGKQIAFAACRARLPAVPPTDRFGFLHGIVRLWTCLDIYPSSSVFYPSVSFQGRFAAQGLFVKPVKVLGDPAFIGTASNPTQIEGNGPNVVEGREMSTPFGIALDTSVSPPIVYMADTGNNRVLGFQYATQLTAGSLRT